MGGGEKKREGCREGCIERKRERERAWGTDGQSERGRGEKERGEKSVVERRRERGRERDGNCIGKHGARGERERTFSCEWLLAHPHLLVLFLSLQHHTVVERARLSGYHQDVWDAGQAEHGAGIVAVVILRCRVHGQWAHRLAETVATDRKGQLETK